MSSYYYLKMKRLNYCGYNMIKRVDLIRTLSYNIQQSKNVYMLDKNDISFQYCLKGGSVVIYICIIRLFKSSSAGANPARILMLSGLG